MTSLLLLPWLVTSYLYFAAGQEPCITPKGKDGNCVPIFNCSRLLTLTRRTSDEKMTLLRNSRCGSDQEPDWVCCPSDVCTTPDGDKGTCVALKSCPHLANIIYSNPTKEERRYVETYLCDGPAIASVCCGPQATSGSVTSPTTSTTSRPTQRTTRRTTSRPTRTTPRPTPSRLETTGECQLSAFPPEPNSDCCGREASSVYRIFGGETAVIDEHPWLALLEYTENSVITTRCGGVLISGQYVLTAGHCVTPRRPTSVRLGEYNTDNSGRDCVWADGGGQDCNDGAVSIAIKEIIPHPEHVHTTATNDIALIKLTRIVEYTDFIRPICLPSVDFTRSASGTVYLHAAGWGVTEAQMLSNIKHKIRLPYVPNRDCQPGYFSNSRRLRLHANQICAGGERGRDTCQGDSGGPLMRMTDSRHELVGIVSFGPRRCGSEGVAGVYTKVFHYLSWIESNITA